MGGHVIFFVVVCLLFKKKNIDNGKIFLFGFKFKSFCDL